MLTLDFVSAAVGKVVSDGGCFSCVAICVREFPLKDHLLSIFPLRGMAEYARLSCVPLEEGSIDCTKPFLLSYDQLVLLLADCFEVDEASAALRRLDEGHDVQLLITTDQARHLGFVPKVN